MKNLLIICFLSLLGPGLFAAPDSGEKKSDFSMEQIHIHLDMSFDLEEAPCWVENPVIYSVGHVAIYSSGNGKDFGFEVYPDKNTRATFRDPGWLRSFEIMHNQKYPKATIRKTRKNSRSLWKPPGNI